MGEENIGIGQSYFNISKFMSAHQEGTSSSSSMQLQHFIFFLVEIEFYHDQSEWG
jgi:hypothetical protein